MFRLYLNCVCELNQSVFLHYQFSSQIIRLYIYIFVNHFQALEDEFSYQLEEQERHYGLYLTAAIRAEAAVVSGVSDGGASASGGSVGRGSVLVKSSSKSKMMDRKSSSKSSGSDRSGGGGHGSSSRRSSQHDVSSASSSNRRLSASRHSLLSKGNDL